MRSNRMLVGLGTAMVLVVGGAVAPSSEASEAGEARHRHATSGAAVRAWNQIAVTTLNGLPGPAGGAPPAAAIHMGMVQGAVFDAVNAIAHRRFRPYLLERRFSPWASQDAAAAAAAYGVLHDILSTVPALTDVQRAGLLATLDTQYAGALAAVPDGWAEQKGIAAGAAAAEAMIEARTGDGRFGPSQWVPSSAAGHWSPSIDPVTHLPVLDPTPWVGGVRPFTMASSSQFRTAGPLALTSPQWATELNEVKAIGSATSATRTPTQGYIARWWQSAPVRSWNEVARDLAERHDLDALDTARLLALQNLSGADAAIGCWNDKYHWDFWRPLNAIRRAAEDGNPATVADPTWTPLISAPYPDHPSGHLCLDGAYTTVLRMYFGDTIPGGFSITSLSTLLQAGEPTVRGFGSFSQVLDEIVEARIWAGLHYRTPDLQGRALGVEVAKHAAWNYLGRVGHGHVHH